jgi:L-fuconolactonase
MASSNSGPDAGSALRIDSHQHFWKYEPDVHAWITPEMHVIQKDFLPADLQPILQQAGIDGCVLVQVNQSEDENDYFLQLAADNDFIKGVVGWVDLRDANVEERLAYYKRHPWLKGFRHVLQGEHDRALMLKPSFKRGIAQLQQYGYTYDILIYPDQLGYTRDLVAAFPNQPFVLDHIAKPHIKDRYITEEWKAAIRAVAEYPNLYCKISGMVTEADWHHWKPEHFRVYLDTIVEAFGVNRIMYGSDWPVCLVAASYAQVLQIVQDYFSPFSETDKTAFFGGNAIKFYKL